MGKLGNNTIVSCEKTGCRWASLLPLICWQGPEDDNKGISAEIPEPVAATPRRADSTTLDSSCHSKESWLDHFGLINKFVLPSSWSLLLWSQSSTEHPTTHHYWRSMTELWTTLDHGGDYLPPIWTPCFYFLSFLLPFSPSPSPWMTRICNKLVGRTFELLFLNLMPGIYISKNLLSLW